MKTKVLTTLALLLFFKSAFCQQFEFSKRIVTKFDKSVYGDPAKIKELPGGGYLTMRALPSKQDSGVVIIRLNSKGDTIFAKWLKRPYSSPIIGTYLISSFINDLYVSNNNKYLGYTAALDSGCIKLWRVTCDSNGKNGHTFYNAYRQPLLDSALISHSFLSVKYVPGKCFYIYGISPYAPYNSYVLWKTDTTGKLLWRQDYYDTCSSNIFSLTLLKDRILLTSLVSNKRSTGIRIVWMDTIGKYIDERKIAQPFFKYGFPRTQQTVLLPDNNIAMACAGNNTNSWTDMPWPVVFKFNNIDTVWHRQLSLTRYPKSIDKNNDFTSLKKLIVCPDSGIALYWAKSYYDTTSQGRTILSHLAADGKKISEICVDSIDTYHISYFSDAIATLDNGFAFIVDGAYMLKLKNSPFTSIEKAESPGGNTFIKVYPNPASSSFWVHLENMKGHIEDLALYDQQGRLVRHIFSPHAGTIELSRDNLTPGIYLIRVRGSVGEVYNARVVLE